jgi:hypothetical protein
VPQTALTATAMARPSGNQRKNNKRLLLVAVVFLFHQGDYCISLLFHPTLKGKYFVFHRQSAFQIRQQFSFLG